MAEKISMAEKTNMEKVNHEEGSMKSFEVWIQPKVGNGYRATVRAENRTRAKKKALRAAGRDKKIEFVEVDFRINKLRCKEKLPAKFDPELTKISLSY